MDIQTYTQNRIRLVRVCFVQRKKCKLDKNPSDNKPGKFPLASDIALVSSSE